jgi:hypothetical protein
MSNAATPAATDPPALRPDPRVAFDGIDRGTHVGRVWQALVEPWQPTKTSPT